MNNAIFWMSGCNVAIDKRLNVKAVMYFWQQLSHPTETRFDQIRCEKSNKTQICHRTVGYAGKRRTFNSILNLNYFMQALNFRWPTQKSLWPPNFPSYSCGPLEKWCGPHFKYHCTNRTGFRRVCRVCLSHYVLLSRHLFLYAADTVLAWTWVELWVPLLRYRLYAEELWRRGVRPSLIRGRADVE
jgi:hypothetical protein